MANSKENLKKELLSALSKAEGFLSKTKFNFKDRFDLLEPIRIVPFYGFGSENYVFLKGRVLEKEKMQEGGNGESTLQHLKDTYRRYESDEIPGIKLEAEFAGKRKELTTDSEGFFEVELKFDKKIDYAKAGQKIKLRLLEQKTENDNEEAEGFIFVPGDKAEFGVISDIDDTVLVSHVGQFFESLRLKLMDDATQRHPFSGIAAFLQALKKGSDGKGDNPLFYVSGSEWNLYDVLINFLRYHDIPQGPLLLRDKGTRLDSGSLETSQREYKQEKIRHILETYPNLKFICIGDSGEHDPETYKKIQEQYPGQLIGVYIRDVTQQSRDHEVQEIKKAVEQQGAEMLLVEETFPAARHALGMDWINKDQLGAVREDTAKDSGEK